MLESHHIIAIENLFMEWLVSEDILLSQRVPGTEVEQAEYHDVVANKLEWFFVHTCFNLSIGSVDIQPTLRLNWTCTGHRVPELKVFWGAKCPSQK